MKIVILLFSLSIVQGIQAQQLKRQMLSAAGSSQLVTNAAGSYFIQQSVGQHSVIGTYTVDNQKLRQGYIQPLPAIVLGGNPNDLEIVVFPNPFTEGVVVNLEQGLENDIKVELFDASGRLIKSDTYDATNQLTLPLTGLSQGSYFLQLSSGRQQAVKQLLKL
ncbi:MAG: T9SS type A sorting domain-containing protein [Bacteroidota bacterium]